MNEQMQAVLDSTKIKYELCEMGRAILINTITIY